MSVDRRKFLAAAALAPVAAIAAIATPVSARNRIVGGWLASDAPYLMWKDSVVYPLNYPSGHVRWFPAGEYTAFEAVSA